MALTIPAFTGSPGKQPVIHNENFGASPKKTKLDATPRSPLRLIFPENRQLPASPLKEKVVGTIVQRPEAMPMLVAPSEQAAKNQAAHQASRVNQHLDSKENHSPLKRKHEVEQNNGDWDGFEIPPATTFEKLGSLPSIWDIEMSYFKAKWAAGKMLPPPLTLRDMIPQVPSLPASELKETEESVQSSLSEEIARLPSTTSIDPELLVKID